jgi:hypothetical protein
LPLIGAPFGLFLSFVEDVWGVFIGFYASVPPFWRDSETRRP